VTTFLCIHGAWQGGWVWQRVVPLLEAAGHMVVAPDLAGCGARWSVEPAGISLSTHSAEIAARIAASPEPVVLIGHSYGGMVITGAADRAPGRLAGLIYLDAFVPAHGTSAFDAFDEAGRATCLRRAARDRGLFMAPTRAAAFNVNADDQAMVDQRTRPFPLACFLEAISLTGAGAQLPAAYLLATGWATSFAETAARCRTKAGWMVEETPLGHQMMLDDPGFLAAWLAQQANRFGELS